MLRKETLRCYQEFSDNYDYEGRTQSPDSDDDMEKMEQKDPNGSLSQEDDTTGNRQSKSDSKNCLKNFFAVMLIFIYLLLTAGAAFLISQTISDFLDKVNHPVMSVTYKEVDFFPPPGIALYLGGAELMSCKHYFYNDIPHVIDPVTPEKGDCVIKEVTYFGPFANQTEKSALVVRGPSDVRNRESIFMQFSQNETAEDFSAISYMLFANYSELNASDNQSDFMRNCERKYSMWTFSGGFKTRVKISLVRTLGKSEETVEFRQESSVVKFIDKRPESERTNELFFAVFEWRDPFMQQIRLIVTANPWQSVAILCGVFLSAFKTANFAKSAIRWILKMRKRNMKKKERELNHIN